MILGLDISSSCIGWCVINENEKVLDVGHLEFNKKQKSLYKKLHEFENLLLEIKDKYGQYFKIYVESPLFGSNNQNVVNLLQRWNGMCCAQLYWTFNTEPVLIPNVSALKAVGIKVPKGVKGLERKKFILQYVQNLGIISEDRWALKKTGNPKDWCYDQADAYVIAVAGTKQP
jgi:hypothetical protein